MSFLRDDDEFLRKELLAFLEVLLSWLFESLYFVYSCDYLTEVYESLRFSGLGKILGRPVPQE